MPPASETLAAPADAAGTLPIQFGGNSVSAQVSSGATTYWNALLFEYGRRTRLWYLSNVLPDTDADGTVVWQLTHPRFGNDSIWAVVDSTGAYGKRTR